jgi:membrane protein implicated in regulation of membrane protease activity
MLIVFQGVVPLITFDSITSIVSGTVVAAVGIYLARSFLSFKDTIKEELSQTREQLIKSLGEVKTHVAQHNVLIELVQEQLKDHSARLRFQEQSVMLERINGEKGNERG